MGLCLISVPFVAGILSSPPWTSGGLQCRTASVFQLNQGRAIDTLRQDYPLLWTHAPDLSIFTDNVELHDATGRTRVSGLPQYERLFDAMRFVRRTFLADSQVSYRLVVMGESIRVRWTARLCTRDPMRGTLFRDAPLFYLDGISTYHLDPRGKIHRHTLERLQLRDASSPLRPVPVMPVVVDPAWPRTVPPSCALLRHGGPPLATRARTTRTPHPSLSMEGETPLQRAARERAEDEVARQERRTRDDDEAGMRWPRLFPQQCETSLDCDEPKVCCDLIVARVCCDGGMLIPKVVPQVQLQAIPIPVDDEPLFPGA